MDPRISDTRVLVWDPLVRLGHWALLIAFATAYLTDEDGGERVDLHELAGYAVGAIVAWRIMWGLNGPQHARFSDFVTGPRTALRYLFDLMAGGARRYVGHNPAGGAMVVALLFCLTLTVLTGMLADRGGGSTPPARGEVTVIAQGHADKDKGTQIVAGRRGERVRKLVGEIHGLLANITLALVVIHILGVALAIFSHRENLITAMITGKKRLEN
jgi:cytochrome b